MTEKLVAAIAALLWFLIVILACNQRLHRFLPIVAGLGIVLFFTWSLIFRISTKFASKSKAIAVHLFIALAILFVTILVDKVSFVVLLTRPFQWDVIGNVDGVSSTCRLTKLYSKRNDNDLVAEVRVADCFAPLAQGASFYTVFVHRVGERDTGEELVFQYEPGPASMPSPPKVAWRTDAWLSVVVGGDISQIRKQRHKVDHVTIEYRLGKVAPDARYLVP